MTPGSTPKWQLVAARVGLFLGSILLVCLMGELVLRFVMARNPNQLARLLEPPPYRTNETLRLIDLLRPDPDPLVAYTMRPGQRGRFQEASVRIHRLGGRGRDFDIAREPGTFRIVGLGDSHLFGWGIEEEEIFLEQLPGLLIPPPGYERVETINLAVPGYNAVQEIRAFERVIDTLKPDLVLVLFVGNDADLPNFLYEPPSPWQLNSLVLMEFVGSQVQGLWRRGRVAAGLVESPTNEQGRFSFAPGSIPKRFRALQGWPAATAAYDRLIALANERQIPLVVIFDGNDYTALGGRPETDVHSPATRRLMRHLDQPGVWVVDTQGSVLRHLQTSGLTSDSLWVGETDPHPNATRHRLIAAEVAQALQALPEWQTRPSPRP